MKPSKISMSILLLFLISSFAAADSWTPSHYCSKPVKPYMFEYQWEVDNYNNSVQIYKNCISSFVEEQEDQMENHKDAINEAVDDWNSFVAYELN